MGPEILWNRHLHRNLDFCDKIRFWAKIDICDPKRTFHVQNTFWATKRTLWGNNLKHYKNPSEYWCFWHRESTKIHMSIKKSYFHKKCAFPAPKSNFWWKCAFWIETLHFGVECHLLWIRGAMNIRKLLVLCSVFTMRPTKGIPDVILAIFTIFSPFQPIWQILAHFCPFSPFYVILAHVAHFSTFWSISAHFTSF